MLEFNFVKYDRYFEQLLMNHGMSSEFAHFLNAAILSAIIAILAIGINFLVKLFIIKFVKRWVDKSENTYDDVFYDKGVFNKLSHLASALIIAWLAPIPLGEFPKVIALVKIATNIYMVVIVLYVINSVINALHEIFDSLPIAKNRSVKGYVQVVKTIVFFIGALVILSILLTKDLSSLFAGITAFAAVLMFVFKDAILGLIAGIQISSNDILRIGDYIEMPSKNADGTVIEIKLNTVKILNANKTICTIPTYSFVAESFWNWRGLELSEGRRIRRSINIDMSTIKHCDDKLLKKLKNIELLKPYFAERDATYGIENEHKWQGLHYTNSTLFRAYIEALLRSNPVFIKNMSFMVRHLQPNEHGLPLEIYVYTSEKDAAKYEVIQADILDQIIAMAPEFELRIFQDPTGHDVRKS
jgi:miniconductance mechanosensitive channel